MLAESQEGCPKIVEGLEETTLLRKAKVLSLLGCGRVGNPDPKAKYYYDYGG